MSHPIAAAKCDHVPPRLKRGTLGANTLYSSRGGSAITGRVEAIWIKRAHRAPMDSAEEATLVAGQGLAGSVDRSRRRQVTLLESAAWAACLAELGVHKDPSLRRANILLGGVRLAFTRGRVLVIGDTRLAIGGELTPCERMDDVTPGLQAALRPDWRGGVFAQVLTGGVIRVGDPVDWDAAVPLLGHAAQSP
ncbi:MAG TPA: MOSC domain-containing protein [Gemmatimonadaceae bacterium]|nr:MOSC domain-containing protein [Gemmatimonadaceae bacterium]